MDDSARFQKTGKSSMYITPPYTVVHPTANCPAVMGANLASLTIAHEGRRGVVCNMVEKLFAQAEPDYYYFFSFSSSSSLTA